MREKWIDLINPLIKAQLKKVRSGIVPEFNEDDTTIVIPKSDGNKPLLEQDRCYIVAVEDYILHPPSGFTLHTNWNGGVIPTSKFMMIDVSKTMGKMIKVNAVGYDMEKHMTTSYTWEGWLPEKSIKIVEIL